MAISQARINAVMEDHAFFAGVAPDLREQLAELADVRRVQSGTVLFHEGSRYREFYLLLEGAEEGHHVEKKEQQAEWNWREGDR